MKILRRIAALVVCQAVIPVGGGAQIYERVSSDTSLVSVMAAAEEYVSPDRAVITLQIVTGGATAEAASIANGGVRAAVGQAIEALGRDPGELILWGFATGPAGSGRYGPNPTGSSDPFESKAGLRLILEDLSLLDPVISSALLAGASVSTVEFQSDGFEAALERATETAVARARAQAETMARAEGGRLGGLLRLSTTPDYAGIGMAEQRYMLYPGAPGSDGVMLFPRDGVVKVTVSGEWAFDR